MRRWPFTRPVDPDGAILVARLATFAVVVLGVRYLVWRVPLTATTPLALAVLLIELLSLVAVMVYWAPVFLTKRPPMTRSERPSGAADVLVLTYDESVEVLEATLAGCLAVRGVGTIYVLDDGGRPAMQELCARFGVQYRARAERAFAKAGNLNFGLAAAQSELVVVLDADFVPQPDLLETCLPWFADPRVAVVQGPQEFYNFGSFQHVGRASLWHEQSPFFHWTQVIRDRVNGAIWAGCPAVLRRAAITAVGGIDVSSVSEDLETSWRLHRGGWHTVFVQKPLAFGLAPERYRPFRVQRARWIAGILKFAMEPWRHLAPGLTVGQRLVYLSGVLVPFELVVPVIFPFIALAVVLGVRPPFQAPLEIFVQHWLPYLLSMLALFLLPTAVSRWYQAEKFRMLSLFSVVHGAYLALAARLRGRRIPFLTTPKQAAATTYVMRERVFVATFYLVLLAAFGYGFARWRPALGVVWTWPFIFLSGMSFVALVHAVVAMVMRRTPIEHRLEVDIPAELVGPSVARAVRVISISHRHIELDEGIASVEATHVELPLGSRRLRLGLSPSRTGEARLPVTFVTEADRLHYLQEIYVAGPRRVFERLEGVNAPA